MSPMTRQLAEERGSLRERINACATQRVESYQLFVAASRVLARRGPTWPWLPAGSEDPAERKANPFANWIVDLGNRVQPVVLRAASQDQLPWSLRMYSQASRRVCS
jgi:hypothetical protein